MKAHRFAVPALLTTLLALACGPAVETATDTEPGSSTEQLTVAENTDPAPVAPAATQAPVEQAAPNHAGGGIDGNKDCGGWCHYQCCGDSCTTAEAVACVASCLKYMCTPPTKVNRL